jgi:hypothetical protein
LADSTSNTFSVVHHSDSSEPTTTTTITENETSENYFQTLINAPVFGVYNIGVSFFSSILNLLTWTWSLIWSIFVNISFLFVSIVQSFRFLASPSSIDSQTKIGNDQLVKTILESSQFRDYVSQKTLEHFSEEQISFDQHLEEIYKRFAEKFQNEKEGFDLTVDTREGELNLLRRSILHKLESLSSEQTILSNRLQEQEKNHLKNVELNDLSSKFDLLKEEVLNYGKGLNDDDVNERDLESRLSDLQSRIEKLESELSELKLEAKKCCRNDTYIRELVTSHLEKVLKEDFKSWNDSALLLRDDLEATLIKTAEDLRRDILTTTTEKMRQLAEGETDKTVELILTDVVSRLRSKNVTKNFPENSSHFLVKEEIEKMVKNALVIYDADKTGLFDFALETAGGSVVSTRCTETYVRTGASYTLFGIPIWWPSNNPRTAIQVY